MLPRHRKLARRASLKYRFVRKMPHESRGFYAAPPQLDLSLVLQSCKVYEGESGNQDFGQDYASVSSGCLSRHHVVPGRIAALTASERNAYSKGAFILKAQANNKPFGCPRCGRGFTVKGNMTRHYKYECGQKPRFQCPYCDFRSKQTSNVMSHVRTKHPGCEVKYNYVTESRSDYEEDVSPSALLR